MMLPTIHLNGTSARELFDQTHEAARAIRAAMEAIGRAAPNGRDYYPQGNFAIGDAVTEHRARLAALQKIAAELQKILEHVADRL